MSARLYQIVYPSGLRSTEYTWPALLRTLRAYHSNYDTYGWEVKPAVQLGEDPWPEYWPWQNIKREMGAAGSGVPAGAHHGHDKPTGSEGMNKLPLINVSLVIDGTTVATSLGMYATEGGGFRYQWPDGPRLEVRVVPVDEDALMASLESGVDALP